MFDFVEKTFNRMAFLLQEPIDLAHRMAVAAGRDHSLPLPCFDGLPDVTDLFASQHEIQEVAQGVRDGVDFGAKSAPRSAQGFGLGIALRSACRAGMGADNGESISTLCKSGRCEHPRCNACQTRVAAPAGEALEHGVPLARPGRQQAPLHTRPQHPQHRRQEGPARLFRGGPNRRMGRQYQVDRMPFVVADFESVRYVQKALTSTASSGYANRTFYEPSAVKCRGSLDYMVFSWNLVFFMFVAGLKSAIHASACQTLLTRLRFVMAPCAFPFYPCRTLCPHLNPHA